MVEMNSILTVGDLGRGSSSENLELLDYTLISESDMDKHMNSEMREQIEFLKEEKLKRMKRYNLLTEHHHKLNEEVKQMIRKTYGGLDYEEIENELYLDRIAARTRCQTYSLNLAQWCMFALIGIFTGIFGFFIMQVKEILGGYRWDHSHDIFAENEGVAYIYFLGVGLGYVLVATLLVVFVAPHAGGSGIAKVKGYLNGVDQADIFHIKVLFVKAVGIILAISGGMPCGDEGPMVHIGSTIGGNVGYIRFSKKKIFEELKNDKSTRDFISAGAACGISAAFGAPIGGLLFSFEEASSFWTVPLMFKVFLGSFFATLFLNLLRIFVQDNFINLNAGQMAVFMKLRADNYKTEEYPVFLIVGIIGGLLGAFFNFINSLVMKVRSKYFKTKAKKIGEVIVLNIFFTTVFFCIPLIFGGNCVYAPKEERLPHLNYYQYKCSNSSDMNDLANLAYISMEDVIKDMYQQTEHYAIYYLAFYSVIFTVLTAINFGCAVPSGLFVPHILIGSVFGRCIGESFQNVFDISDLGVYAMLGSAAMLAGSMRIALCLTVIMIETTRNATFLIPIMIATFIGKYIGDIFNISIVDQTIESSHMPYVETHPPKGLEQITAGDVAIKDVKTFLITENAYKIYHILSTTSHNGFPVLDDEGHLVGLIYRKQVLAILREKLFFDMEVLEQFKKTEEQYSEDPFGDKFDFHHKWPSVRQKVTSSSTFYYNLVNPQKEEKTDDLLGLNQFDIEALRNKFAPLKPFMKPFPHSCHELTPLTRVYNFYRSLGLRHLPVVDTKNKLTGIITRKELMTIDFSTDLY